MEMIAVLAKAFIASGYATPAAARVQDRLTRELLAGPGQRRIMARGRDQASFRSVEVSFPHRQEELRFCAFGVAELLPCARSTLRM